MRKRYILALTLAAGLRMQAHGQNAPTISFGPSQLIDAVEVDVDDSPVEFLVPSRVKDAYTIDLDGDGDLDVLAATYHTIAWYANDGQGNFGDQQLISTQIAAGEVVYATDLDGDGDLDVLSISSLDDVNEGKIAWYENDGSGTFGEQQVIDLGGGPSDGQVIDLDGDGDDDVLASFSYDNQIAWYANDGQGNFGDRQIITTQAPDPRSVYAIDLDGDGDVDVLSASAFDDKIAWYENDGIGNFGPQQIIATQTNGARSAYAADLDGDGDQDVLSASRNDDKIAWYENDGQGNFGEQQAISTELDRASNVYTIDLDGDGDQDVLASSSSFSSDDENELVWYANDGQGNFGEPQDIANPVEDAYDFIHAADLNEDGKVDVLSSTQINQIVWYQNLGNSLAPRIDELTLINARTNEEVQTLTTGDVIDLSYLSLQEYNIKATLEETQQKITRLTFDLTAPARQDTVTNEFKVPYALYGDKPNGEFRRRRAYAGDYQLTVTPYYQDKNGNEIEGISRTVSFTFTTPDLRFYNLGMKSSDYEDPFIAVLDDGVTVRLTPDQPVTIIAYTTNFEDTGVEFFLDGPNPDGIAEVHAFENVYPFALFGDGGSNDNLNGRIFEAGEYELRAILYQNKKRNGYLGPEKIIRFTVITEGEEASTLVYPMPLQDEATVRLSAEVVSSITLQHAYGQTYAVPMGNIQVSEEGVRVNLRDLKLPAGPYVLQVVQGNEVKRISVVKE